MKVLVVGAGVTGTGIAAMLRKAIGPALQMSLWERESGPGGRMCSIRAPTAAGLPDARVDGGAQYISRRVADDRLCAELRPYYDVLTGAGVLVPFTGRIQGPSPYASGPSVQVEDMVAPDGLGAVTERLLEMAAPQDVQFDRAVREVDVDSAGGVLRIDGDDTDYDAVVLTMPPPQLLSGGLRLPFMDRVPASVQDALGGVQFSTRYAVGVFWPPGTDLGPSCQGWVAQYFKEGAVRYVAQDARKRDCLSQGPTLLVHSSVPFALRRPGDSEPWAEAEALLLAELAEKLPGLPPPAAVRTHRWHYSQVYKGYSGKETSPHARPMAAGPTDAPGFVELATVNGGGKRRAVFAAGDAFATAGNFEGAMQSALVCSQRIEELLAAAAAHKEAAL